VGQPCEDYSNGMMFAFHMCCDCELLGSIPTGKLIVDPMLKIMIR
jgi:hypothetical protein